MDELLADFLTEATEILAELDAALLRLERCPRDRETLFLIFRLVHTIKGTCGFLGLQELERLAHGTETVLGQLRDAAAPASTATIAPVLAAVARMRGIVAYFGVPSVEPAGDPEVHPRSHPPGLLRRCAPRDDGGGGSRSTVGDAWKKLPGLVRDLERRLGKRIALTMRGGETELDWRILELLRDPLLHMVRNSADHGLEEPRDRLAAGKPATGRIALEAFREDGEIVIRIADDGRGLEVERIRRRAVAAGLASAAELASMSDRQVQAFIFRPGFSTSPRVTQVSGRGVGMDLVRTNIERMGGTITVDSVPGAGTAFVMRIPLAGARIGPHRRPPLSGALRPAMLEYVVSFDAEPDCR